MTLRLRLTLLFVALIAAIGVLSSAVVVVGFSQTLRAGAVSHVQNKAKQVQDYMSDLDGERRHTGRGPLTLTSSDALPRAFSDDGMFIQLTDPTGSVLNRSPNLGERTLPTVLAEGLQDIALPQATSTESNMLLMHARRLALSDGRQAGWVQVAFPLDGNDRALRQVAWLEAAGLGAALVISTALGLLFAGSALRPIATMTRQVQEMQSTDLHRRLEVGPYPHDELGQLASTFNGLFDRLEIAFEAQRRFVADASHELKSPLTTVRGNLQLLQRRGFENPTEARHWAEAALREVDRLTRLVHELLALALAGEGKLPLHRGPVDVAGLALDVAKQFEAIAPRVTVTADGPAVVQGDADRLRQVLINLLDNAARATREGGTIAVSVRLLADRVRLTVSDTGIGIAGQHLPRLFDRFYRVDSARGRNQGGTGLGLPITQAIVLAHGGKIEVGSELGHGTTFTVTLPIRPSEA